MTINEYLEDYDNSELNSSDWYDQMEEAVDMYNEEYRASYTAPAAIRNYKSWKRENNPNLTEPRE